MNKEEIEKIIEKSKAVTNWQYKFAGDSSFYVGSFIDSQRDKKLYFIVGIHHTSSYTLNKKLTNDFIFGYFEHSKNQLEFQEINYFVGGLNSKIGELFNEIDLKRKQLLESEIKKGIILTPSDSELNKVFDIFERAFKNITPARID
ncbi:MAG: hypothetical protein QXP53_00390 [Candidatus Pacearchaeota archaeon]